MDKVLRPEKLDVDINTPDAAAQYKFWERTLHNLINTSFKEKSEEEKLSVLTQYLTYKSFPIVEDASTYTEAITLLQQQFVKKKNEIFARYLLYTRKQKSEEDIDEYMSQLKMLSKDCNYKQVSAQQHLEESLRDSFITGLKSQTIRQRLLEETVSLQQAWEKARSVETAQLNADSYNSPGYTASVTPSYNNHPDYRRKNDVEPRDRSEGLSNVSAASPVKCWNCGRPRHTSRQECPAYDKPCFKCGKKGHFSKLCRNGGPPKRFTNAAVVHVDSELVEYPILAATNPHALNKSIINILVDGEKAEGLVDSGSSHGYISESYTRKRRLKMYPMSSEVAMASLTYSTPIHHYVLVDILFNNRTYQKSKLMVLPGCVSDVILGIDFQQQHQQVTFIHKGHLPPLEVCGSVLKVFKVDPPELFTNLTSDCHPLRERSRRYSQEDQAFITQEVARLEAEGVIERSNSPWRAQVIVVKDKPKKRLAIDYSSTINQFTMLDAYPLPNIKELINQIALYNVHSTIDMYHAYHQIPIKAKDKPYTAFEANHRLYQFTRLPFGVTNGVAVFQRIMDTFVEENSLTGVFPYMDNVTISGHTQEQHDSNLKKFMIAAKKANLTFNEDKCTFSTRKLCLLGSLIENGEIKPDPERLRPLKEMPVPHDMKSLKRAQGFFSYYSAWIQNFSQKLKPLLVTEFPLPAEAVSAFNQLKLEVEKSVVAAVDESLQFQLETDASDNAIAATLNQAGRPVAFFSRSLHGSELNAPAIEKEAQAIVESVRYWRHFLTRKHFAIRTDQKSISYVFDCKHRNKIKNDKISRWKLELSCYQFDIKHKPGVDNVPPDTLSRAYCSSTTENNLKYIHDNLCHPGVTRMFHYVRSKNLPYSIEEVKSLTRNCSVCCEEKPRFYKPDQAHLIKSTTPFERINVDFKGPLPSTNHNRYFLHVVDEYSRFPFVFPCKDLTSETVKQSLSQLFSLFGHPTYIHTDRGQSFMSKDLKEFLLQRGVASSRTTPYHPESNGQVERFNSTVWKAIKLVLKGRGLPITQWQEVLPEALHAVRSLLCTATNTTPHERFFSFPRRSSTGSSVPSWLMTPGPVLLRKFVRNSKNDPLVEEVELVEVNPQYAHIKYSDGRESTVSIQDLAPKGTDKFESAPNEVIHQSEPVAEVPEMHIPNHELPSEPRTELSSSEGDATPPVMTQPSEPVQVRRSNRTRKPNPKFNDYVCSRLVTLV